MWFNNHINQRQLFVFFLVLTKLCNIRKTAKIQLRNHIYIQIKIGTIWTIAWEKQVLILGTILQ